MRPLFASAAALRAYEPCSSLLLPYIGASPSPLPSPSTAPPETESFPFLCIADLARGYRARRFSPVDVVQACLDRIAALDGPTGLNSFLTVTGDAAMAQAKGAERELARGDDRGPLHGIPIALKDLFATAGIRTTAGSRILADWVPDDDATVVRRLRDAGALVLGKTSLFEFAFHASGQNPHFGPCRNPWNRERDPGGSSGGSAAAVAAGLCPAALGTDTGGSVRLPAALCGVVGLKPTYGRISRTGVIPLAASLDHVGFIARSVEDVALLLDALSGPDAHDPTCLDLPVPRAASSLRGPDGARGLRIGLPRELVWNGVSPAVERAVHAAIAQMAELGATVESVELPAASLISPSVSTILVAEAAAYHQPWLRERPTEYGEDVRTGIEIGSCIAAADYLLAMRARAFVVAEACASLGSYDALVMPTAPETATTHGASTVATNPFNLLGFPAVSLPCGFDDDGLAIGVQLVGRPWDEATLLRAAHAYEQAAGWWRRHPA